MQHRRGGYPNATRKYDDRKTADSIAESCYNRAAGSANKAMSGPAAKSKGPENEKA